MLSARVLRLLAGRSLGYGALSLLWTACGGEDISAPTTGEVRITVSTGGPTPDQDGYTLSLDNGPAIAVSSNATLALTVEQGAHTLELGALENDCAVQDGNRREVQVTAGEAATVEFIVVCGPTTGGLRVVTTTSGLLPDPDGYTLTVDNGQPQLTGTNATAILTGLAPGNHLVQLSGIADNCGVTTENPLTVSVVAGGFAEATFEVSCTASVRQWTPLSSGTTADLSDTWGSSPADLFAVGEIVRDEPFELASVIRHYDGTVWVQQLRQVDVELLALWGSSPTDVFAVGADFFSPDARVFHFDGTQWSPIPAFEPSPFEESIRLGSVWGSSATDVFAVGSAFDGEFDHSLIFHFNGSDWQRILVTGDVRPQLLDVWGDSPSDVYAVGNNQEADPSTGVILRYDGVSWRPVLEEAGLAPNSVWGSSATDIFVAGFQVTDDDVFGVILHYDGSHWSHMTVPTVGILDDVWGSSATDVFAVGEEGAVLHFDGTTWTLTNPTRRTLLGIWGFSPADVFAVGDRGIVLHGTP